MSTHSRSANNLIRETSPYLLQHAYNPVEWNAWGDEALQRAKAENKVILISIGYSACHWCHVMERESFEDEATAEIMNSHFVNIKIDREERPDIDHIYMDAVQAMTGSGGWPLNVFLTPDAKPFYGGTYFPPEPAFNRPSWKEVLQSVANAWIDRKSEIISQSDNLVDYLGKPSVLIDKKSLPTVAENGWSFVQCEAMFTAIMKSADTVWGGFGKAPKFPQTFSIRYLFEYYHYSGDKLALQQALLSLNKMLEGGIYDHVGGGLARYSTDEEWLAPHFEKMLYDNALLIMALCDAFQITRDVKYENAIDKTIAFIAGELKHEQGGFYAALDADSEGEEGKFYVWQKDEIENILGDDAVVFCDYFDITPEGNWEGKNILRILKPTHDYIKDKGIPEQDFLELIDRSLKRLFAERNKRPRPGLDDKIIVGWNALMLKALAMAAVTLKKDEYKDLAVDNYQFIINNFNVTDNSMEMLHTWKEGAAKYPAFLDDYAYFIDASLHLYELTLDVSLLLNLKKMCDYVIKNFGDDDQVLFFYTNFSQQDIIVRKKDIYDGAIPSANAVMAKNLLKLAIIFDLPLWRKRVEQMITGVAPSIIKYPSSFAVWASVFQELIKGTTEIAVIGARAFSIAAAIQSDYYLPGKIVMASNMKNDFYPLLSNKPSIEHALIYVCRQYVCNKPLNSLDQFSAEVKTHKI